MIDGQATLATQRGEVQLGVEYTSIVGVTNQVASGDVGGTTGVEAQHDGFVAVRGQHEILEVQQDVGDVFGNPSNGVELVQRIVEAHLGDSCARESTTARCGEASCQWCDRSQARVAKRRTVDGSPLPRPLLRRLGAELPAWWCYLKGLQRGTPLRVDYLLYSSTMSCSRTRYMSICSRIGQFAHGTVESIARSCRSRPAA